MRIAVFSDIHGNIEALETVLEDLEKQKVDMMVCAGDLVNPLASSPEVLRRVESLGIPTLRGNHEDYIIRAHRKSPEHAHLFESLQYRAVALAAECFNADEVERMAKLPLDLEIPVSSAESVYICHASPLSNSRSHFSGIDAQMSEALSKISSRVVVGAHLHQPLYQEWKGKLLVNVGSVGMPLQGSPKASYSILSHHGSGKWTVENRELDYDVDATLKAYVDSGFMHKGGPTSWILYNEFASGQHCIAPIFAWAHENEISLETDSDWLNASVRFLKDTGRWDRIAEFTHAWI